MLRPASREIDDGFVLGFGTDALGDQPTHVSGANNGGNLSATFLHSYPIAGADSGSHAPRDAHFVVNFPSAGTYPFEIDYQEDGFAALQLVLQAEGRLVVTPPTVKLAKASVAAAGADGFSGSGFAGGEIVNAYLDKTSGTLIGSATATSGGEVSGSVTIPAGTTTGKHAIVFAGHTTGASTQQVVKIS